MKNRSILFLTLLFAIVIAANLISPSSTASVSAAHPQADFSPPSSQSGTGHSIGLADSVNAWQLKNLGAGNTLATCQSPYRNTSFSQPPPSNFPSTAWQNLSVSGLTAAPDFREVQFASSPTGYLELAKGGTFSQAAMRFRLPDAVNLTSIWLCYNSSAATPQPAQLHVISKGTNPDSTPQGGSLIATSTLPAISGTPNWNEVVLSKPVTLTKSNYYWIVLNASTIAAARRILWSFINDSPPSAADQKPAAAYTTTWVNETTLRTSYAYPYLNLLLVLKVLPVVSSNPSKILTYSSPSQVKMIELNSFTLMSKNSTRIPSTVHSFKLGTNTSVSFTINWTARLVKYQPSVVATEYFAQAGNTSWNALFTSGYKPLTYPYTWSNRTLRITPIPTGWQIDPMNDVTNDNNINFTTSYVIGSGYITISQTDNVSATPTWAGNWVISAKSSYSITASAPSQAIMGQGFSLSASTVLANTHCNLTVYDSTDSLVFSRSVTLPEASTYGFQIMLNQTGNFVVTLFNEADSVPEVSYLVMPTIASVPALTSLELQSSTLRASWGDIITIAFRYMNTTLGSNREFPSPPKVIVSPGTENFTMSGVQATGAGWFSFSFETRLLPSSGGYILTITVSFEGSYLNQKTFTLQLDPPGISPILVVLAGGGSAGAVIAVVATRKYLTTRRAKEEEKEKILRQTASLAQLVVVHLGSGRAAYSRSLGSEESVDPNLISGFLTANQSIMGQVFKGKAPSGLKFADYGEYKVISHVGKYIMASLFCTEAAGEELQSVLEKFTDEFEKKYEKELVTWDGNVDIFTGADSMADRVFSLRLISPYVLVLDRLAKAKLSGIEKAVVDSARRLSATRGIFFMPRIIDFLLTSKKAKRSKIVDIIDSLVKKGVFKQLTVDEAAQIISLTEYGSGPNSNLIGDLLENGS